MEYNKIKNHAFFECIMVWWADFAQAFIDGDFPFLQDQQRQLATASARGGLGGFAHGTHPGLFKHGRMGGGTQGKGKDGEQEEEEEEEEGDTIEVGVLDRKKGILGLWNRR